VRATMARGTTTRASGASWPRTRGRMPSTTDQKAALLVWRPSAGTPASWTAKGLNPRRYW
jgi:hypothetical protein